MKLGQTIIDATNTSHCGWWLDLANAFQSIHPNLIVYVLWHYHLPGYVLYPNHPIYATKLWETCTINASAL